MYCNYYNKGTMDLIRYVGPLELQASVWVLKRHLSGCATMKQRTTATKSSLEFSSMLTT
jgi:hypothetical protein